MRIGESSVKNQKRRDRRVYRKAGELKTPRHVSADSVVGRLDGDYIGAFLAPKLVKIAQNQLEDYASQELEREDSNNNNNNNYTIPPPPLFDSQYQVKEFESLLSDTSQHFINNDWKIHVTAAKFERHLNEKYGVFLPIIKNYPQVERYLRTVQRQYNRGYYSPIRQGPAPIPKSTAIVILIMMYRGGISWDKVGMATLFFIVGLQPWALVGMVVVVHLLVNRRKQTPIKPMSKNIPLVTPYYSDCKTTDEKYDLLRQPVGTKISDTTIDMQQYDCMVIGSGPDSLYTAALLSRSGRRVLVLSKDRDASRCSSFKHIDNNPKAQKYKDLPFDIDATNISKLSKQLKILSPAICTTDDTQGGVRFAQVGTEADDYAFEIVSIPGVGTERYDESIPFVLSSNNNGLTSLMDLAATSLGDAWADTDGSVGQSTTGQFVKTCEAINDSASAYYLSKVLPDNVNSLRSKSAYEETAIRHAAAFLDRAFPLNPHTRCFMAGLGIKGENIRPSDCSMGPHVTNICAALDGEGMHYPIGGPRSLCRALANIVEKHGGRICTDVSIDQLLFGKESDASDNSKNKDTKEETDAATASEEKIINPPACIGVKLDDGTELKFDEANLDKRPCKPSVVSMEGFLWTFLIAMPDNIRTKYKVPPGLPALSSRRPQFKALFALKGSASDLEVTGADFYRLPAASIAFDEIDGESGDIKQGVIGWKDDENDKPVTVISLDEHKSDNASSSTTTPTDDVATETVTDVEKPKAKKSSRRQKFESGYSWIHISFPSAKDPSFQAVHGDVTTCVVTIEADDDFVTFYDSRPKLYALKGSKSVQTELERLLDRVKKELFVIYPQLEDKVEHGEIQGPYQKGLSHNPERYAAKGIRPESTYPQLYCGGSDLTVGDSFSAAMVGGWLVANAVVGFVPIDYMFLERHVTNDIVKFMSDEPDVADEDDVAVPLRLPSTSHKDETKED